MDKVSWPQAVRAEASATAYRTALDWIRRLPVGEVVRRLEEKVQEKEEVLQEYNEQGRTRNSRTPNTGASNNG